MFTGPPVPSQVVCFSEKILSHIYYNYICISSHVIASKKHTAVLEEGQLVLCAAYSSSSALVCSVSNRNFNNVVVWLNLVFFLNQCNIVIVLSEQNALWAMSKLLLWMTAGSKGQSFKVRRWREILLLLTSSNVPNDIQALSVFFRHLFLSQLLFNFHFVKFISFG